MKKIVLTLLLIILHSNNLMCIDLASSDCNANGSECLAGQNCIMIQSEQDSGLTSGYCVSQNSSINYCQQKSDCPIGQTDCVAGYPGTSGYNSYFSNNGTIAAGTVGVCGVINGGSAENNAFGQVMCNGLSLVTGKAGRAVMAAIVCVIGMLFFTGKVSWSLIITMALGVGSLFGAPAVISVVTGKKFSCGN